MDCGPTCLRIISKFYGKSLRSDSLRKLSNTTRLGSSLYGISEAAETLGFRTISIKCNFDIFEKDASFPCIVHWRNNHFLVVYAIKKGRVYISDPASTKLIYSTEEFIEGWIGTNATRTTKEGVVLLIDPAPQFFDLNEDKDDTITSGFSFIGKYFLRHKKFLFQLILALAAGSLLSLIFPFLTQSIVDVGIENKDMGFIYLILISQLFLTIGQTTIELIRSWVLLHLSTRINVSLVSDFFVKLMKLPISFFDVKMTGDIMQRIGDHARIESFLTSSTLQIMFSLINAVIFSVLLLFFSSKIFFVFLIFSVAYVAWIFLFMKRRAKLDHANFSLASREQSKVMELITGMQDIKLHNAERQKRWGWEYLQASLFKLKIKSLSLEQTQSVGSNMIHHFQDILISILSAKAVIDGELTLGMMMAVSYIVGQINAPVNQFVSFIHQAQNARISLNRLTEIHSKPNEEEPEDEKISDFSVDQDITINQMSFKYPGTDELVLNDISLTIPANKITAIVGASGGGKTTLMKMLIKFYDPLSGEIKIGPHDFKNISQHSWRSHIGVVMQEGFIFNDTIANNIVVHDGMIDKAKLHRASEIANINRFIQETPKGYNTKIGAEGIGISTGQKQRIFIARAVYKNPDIILFDEPTSSLDANNESTIMHNLNKFLTGRTAVIIAHRLSTIKNADQIVVLERGRVSETGTHQSLIEKRGAYYNLIKNQLELELLQN
jgi:ATP-binding cassette subfamily B protein